MIKRDQVRSNLGERVRFYSGLGTLQAPWLGHLSTFL